METVAVEQSPCDLVSALASVASGDPSLKDATLLCAASAACCCELAPPASTAEAAAARVPAWLSVTVTCTLDVVIQVQASLASDGLANLFGCCHGVAKGKSKPQFARVTCENAQKICALLDGIIKLPLSPADVVATDVSTCSTCVHAANLLSEPSGSKVGSRSLRGRGAGGADGVATRSSSVGVGCQGCRSACVDSCAADRLGVSTLEATACLARRLPTVALLVRFPQRCRRALVLLRPSVGWRHKRYRMTYHASARLVSESVQRVALMPGGDAAVLLDDTFIRDESTPVCAADKAGGASATLALRGNYLPLHDVEQRSGALQPLHLHLGLLGASARQRVLRSLLRCRVTGAWCRPRFPSRGASCCLSVAAELVLYSSEGHALVFERVMADMMRGSAAVEGKDNLSLAVVYTCSAGAHLLCSKLDASTAAASMPASRSCDGICRGALLVAPPWRFADQWRHSPRFTRMLALTEAPSVALSGVLESGEGRRRQRRHRACSVLAMSPNRQVWLLRAGSQLRVVSMSTGTGAMGEHEDVGPTLTSAVQLDPSHVLHDAQYVACGGHAGFLLLCRHNSMVGAAESWDATSAMHSMTATSPIGDRFVHCARSQVPVRVLFLSLTAMATATAAFASTNAAISPLLPVPLIPSPILASLPPSFTLPSNRLRLVCAVSAANTSGATLTTEMMSDTLYIVISSSGEARQAWKATVCLPSVWPSCTSLLQLCPSESTGVAGRGEGAATAEVSRAASALKWTAHALSALFPQACLMRGNDVVSAWKAAVQGTTAPSCMRSPPSFAVVTTEEEWPLETVLEAALLELNYPYNHGAASPVYTLDAPRGSRADTDGAASYHSSATLAFHDALHAFLHACFCGDEVSTAGAVAVFAGFSTALRMSGLLLRCRAGLAARDGGVPVTMRVVAFLHGCAQLLRRAMEDIAAVGDVSALLACASHLTPTVVASAARQSPSSVAPATWEVWGLLLQPLFDFVWGAVQAYGISAEVATRLLDYCSPAVRSMVHARVLCLPDRGNTLHAATPGHVAAPASVDDAPRLSGPAVQCSSPELPAPHAGVDSPSAPRTSGPTPASLSPAAAVAAATSSYTSAELYEAVHRVFLLQGAAAALRLLDELRRHESTKAGAAEMAQILVAMQHRLQGVAV
ncbi:hypothetical protein LSCM1_04059 [Leishmania martiniquensis]|uniref:Uncharacterized protein n=1 Tax=Leishmania martiniquensis TaxID=1580590 RepID=A0A836GYX0_9TRYP|nr:hypothetical protein LSCM1_04059 [Leishmania martiniquensis]